MKTLNLFIALNNDQHRKNGRVRTLPLIGVVVGVAILLFAYGLFKIPLRQNRAMARIRAEAASQLSVELAIRPALAARSSLTVLSRLPVLRDIKAGAAATGALNECRAYLDLLIQSLELPISALWRTMIDVNRARSYWGEVPEALMRRFLLLASFRFYEPFTDDVEPDFDFKSLTAADNGSILAQSRLVPASLQFLQELAARIHGPAGYVASFLDSLPGIRDAGKVAAEPVNSLLALMLDDGQFRALALKSLHGKILAMAGEVESIEEFADTKDCQAISGGSVFFSGPVFFDNRHRRSVWLVSVPVRDEQRHPVGCLTAMVDVGYLGQIAGKLASGPDRLIFVDRAGIAIGHENSEMVAAQVNLGASLPALESIGGEPFFRVVGGEQPATLQAVTSIKKSGYRHLPDWYVVVQARINPDNSFERFIITACVILLAAMGMYVLSCCVVRITFFANEEMQ